MAGALIWLNVGVVEKSFAIFDAREGVTDVRFASTDGFDLTALQLDASLVALENVIIAQRLAIKNRLGSHDRALKRDGNSGAVRGILNRFVGELTGDDFLERNVGEGSARTYLHHRPMSQTELTHALGDNVDQELLIGDDLGCFLKELSRHIAQGTDGAVCFRRELKNGRRVAHESGRKKQGSDHGNEKANRDFAGGAPGCQTDLLRTPRSHCQSRSMCGRAGSLFRQPRLDTQSFRPPLADPSAPSVESKRNESSSRHEFVNLGLPWGCLHAGTKIVVDHKPTTIGQQIAIAIQVSPHIAIRIENEEAHFTAGQHLPKSVSTSGSCGSE